MWVFEIHFKESVRTNLTLRELFDIYSFTRSLPQDRILKRNVSGTYLDNPHLLDEEFQDLTFDSTLSKEKKSIAVLNGTNVPGVAKFASRVIKNAGGRVVAVGNTKETYEESYSDIIPTPRIRWYYVWLVSAFFNYIMYSSILDYMFP